MKGRKTAKSTKTRAKSQSTARSPVSRSSSVAALSSMASSPLTHRTSPLSRVSRVSVAPSRAAISTSIQSSPTVATAQRRRINTSSIASVHVSTPAMSFKSKSSSIPVFKSQSLVSPSFPATPFTTAMRTQVTAALVKKVRDSTGAPMIECKKALTAVFESDEYDTSTDAAVMSSANEYLRKRGTALAAKNASRSALEGAVALAINKDKTKGVILELNCETDFVARNGTFLGYASRTALTILEAPIPKFNVDAAMNGKFIDVNDFQESKLFPGPSAMPSNPDAQNNTVARELIDVINNCRENIRLRRAAIVNLEDGADGFVAAYIHNELPFPDDFKPFHDQMTNEGYTLRLGNAGALGAFKLGKKPSQAVVEDAELMDLGRKIMMQVVASSPEYLHRSAVPQAIVDKEKEIMLAVTDTTGKDPKIVDRLIQGKLSKFFEGIVLLDQQFIVTNDTKKPTVNELLKSHQLQPELTSVVRYLRGENPEADQEASPPAQ